MEIYIYIYIYIYIWTRAGTCVMRRNLISDFLEKYHILPYMFLCNIGLFNLKGLSVGCSRRQEIKLNLG